MHDAQCIDRLIAEYEALQARRVSLGAFLSSETYRTLPDEERADLHLQALLMQQLDAVLARRIQRATS